MAQQKFGRTIELSSDVSRAWEVLTDVQELVTWVSVVHSVQEIEYLQSYAAVLEDRVGPFNLRADLSIAVTVPTQGEAIDVVASGRDRAINSKIDIKGHLRLQALPQGGTQLTVNGSYTVTGRAAAMGAGIVRKKGDLAVEEFFANAARALHQTDPAGLS